MPQPFILIDGSPLSSDQEHQVWRASLPTKGRALTLYEEVHPALPTGQPQSPTRFFRCPQDPVAGNGPSDYYRGPGFRVPFYRYVENTLGWHWLGRIRHRDFIVWQEGIGESRFSLTSLYLKVTTKPAYLGTVQWVRRSPLTAFLVLVGRPPKGRR